MHREPERGTSQPGCWTVERLVAGGYGLVRLPGGRVAFAAAVAPGDRIEPISLAERRGTLFAERWRLQSAGPGRVAPPCPEADRCGGCDFMHLELSTQREAKRGIIAESLERIAGIREGLVVASVRSAGEPWRYRSRLRLHVDRRGRVGLFARSSRAVVEIEDCLVCAEPLSRAMRDVRARVRGAVRSSTEPFDVEIRVADEGAPAVLRLTPSRRRSVEGSVLRALGQHYVLSVEPSLGRVAARSSGPGSAGSEQRYPLPGGVRLWAPADAFTQVNWPVNLAMVGRVLEWAAAGRCRSFVDLYCGAGNFSLPLLARGLGGTAVDQTASAVDAASRAARAQGLDGGTFRCSDVAEELERIVRGGQRCDLVVLDPPRAGAPSVAEGLAALGPRFVALCSCDPASAARDLGLLSARGFRLVSVEGFDMFPQTHHVELLAWLETSG